MTKTLTEQWREGKLPPGKYYIKTKWYGCDGKWHYEKEEDIDYLDGDWRFYQDDAIEEILGPVPDYMDCKGLIYDSINLRDARKRIDELVSKTEQLVQKMNTLEKRLAIATKALKDIKVYSQRDWDEYNCMECADKALKEMEGVK